MGFASETNNWNLGYQQRIVVKSFSYSASIRHNGSDYSQHSMQLSGQGWGCITKNGMKARIYPGALPSNRVGR
jgi:hypothetical protein